ncbi:hypothetical protein B0H11DRAFT_1928568 [Mycena galericulata]|nr:hypothetical protein B0H11DRAFT_1928568 [Mycena galericulata]
MSNLPRYLEIGSGGLYYPRFEPDLLSAGSTTGTRSTAAPATNSNNKSEVDIVPTQPSYEFGRRRAIDRAQRALCRVLVKLHDIPPLLIQRRFGWSTCIINRAAENHYSPEDQDVEEDFMYLPEDFPAILEALIDENNKDGAGDVGDGKHLATKKTKKTRRYMYGPPKSRSKRQQRKAPASPPSAPERASGSHDVPAAKISEPLIAPPPPTLTPDELFLRTFVENIPLNGRWYLALKSAGFTEETLRRTAGIPKLKVDEFDAATFPEMTLVERFLFRVANTFPADAAPAASLATIH